MTEEPTDDLQRLRELLLGEDRERLDTLTNRLDDDTIRSQEVGAVLSRAIVDRNARADDLSSVLEPQIEEALARSIQKDPGRITDVVFPIIGPVIRRSIRHALADIVQRLNKTVEHSLTVGGLRMRWEAARTGVPFAEVVLRRSLLYRVEQIFVIHRETSLLLAQAVDESAATSDPDMVSSMLTVVQDFVRDSLTVEEGDALDSMSVGELSIWIEPGPKAILAATIRGDPPQSLRQNLSELLAEVHREYAAGLDDFDGDLAPFAPMVESIQAGLESQEDSTARDRKVSPMFILLSTVLVTLMGVLAGSRIIEGRRLDTLVRSLGAEPGIEVTGVSRADGRLVIAGLRDPLAADPFALAESARVDTSRINFRWEAFLAGAPSLVATRLIQLVEPPAGIVVEGTIDAIAVQGTSAAAWIEELRSSATIIAPHLRLDLSGWTETEGPELQQARALVGGSTIDFVIGSAALSPDARATLSAVAVAARELIDAGAVSVLVVRGHLDRLGPVGVNQRLRADRANGARAALEAEGIASTEIRVELVDPIGDEPGARRVTFAVEPPSPWDRGERP